MVKILLGLVVILLVGAGLGFALPPFEPPSGSNTTHPYKVDQQSLSNPLSVDSFYLITPLPKDAVFTLKLGLYDQLPQAVTFIKTLPPANDYRIVKATDNRRFWYLVLKGKYAQQGKAISAQQDLNNSQIHSTLMLLPTPKKKK